MKWIRWLAGKRPEQRIIIILLLAISYQLHDFRDGIEDVERSVDDVAASVYDVCGDYDPCEVNVRRMP